MKPTDIEDPNFFHRVVDCQWACPAHTNVPEYLRLIGEGRYVEAYLENRKSNVFPGILGRTCDRPCEPACRRERVDGKPVAICRLKRVAADLAGDITELDKREVAESNGKKIACVGAGPASLTVANDLLPLGYQVTIFESSFASGGLMRTNIPSFRLPSKVLNDEIKVIVDMGAEIHFESEVASFRSLLNDGFDAIFIGSGAPKGKDLDLPGRMSNDDHIHIGMEWLQSVAFGHIETVGERVLVIGVGNTAMDCCRTSLRLGGKSVKVMARRPREFFKASPWELEDAEEEGVEIVVNHIPVSFESEGGRLIGMRFDVVEWDDEAKASQVVDSVVIPCDDVIVAIGQENAFEWIERDTGLEFGNDDLPVINPLTMESTLPGVFFGGDAAYGPKNIIWAVAHGHEAAISINNHCTLLPVSDRLPIGMELQSQKMSIGEWSYQNDYSPVSRQQMVHVELGRRFDKLKIEVEEGFNPEQSAHEVRRCLNCDIQPIFKANLCIECDACIDICPVQCLTITNGDLGEDEIRRHLTAPAINISQPLFVSDKLPQTGRVMIQDENVCVHCGLCAERCPTGAWNMEKFTLRIGYAGDKEAQGIR